MLRWNPPNAHAARPLLLQQHTYKEPHSNRKEAIETIRNNNDIIVLRSRYDSLIKINTTIAVFLVQAGAAKLRSGHQYYHHFFYPTPPQPLHIPPPPSLLLLSADLIGDN